MTGPLFSREKALKQRLCQCRAQHYGAIPEDSDVFLAQIAKCAEFLKVDNPYANPGKRVDVEDIKP